MILQVAVGMVVNLCVRVPGHHPGAEPSDYLSGYLSSVGSAIGPGPSALAVHAALGLAVVAMALVLAVRADTNFGG